MRKHEYNKANVLSNSSLPTPVSVPGWCHWARASSAHHTVYVHVHTAQVAFWCICLCNFTGVASLDKLFSSSFLPLNSSSFWFCLVVTPYSTVCWYRRAFFFLTKPLLCTRNETQLSLLGICWIHKYINFLSWTTEWKDLFRNGYIYVTFVIKRCPRPLLVIE